MSLTKEQSIDKVEIVENGTIQVRQVTRILENGEQLSSTYHRWAFTPGSDISEMPENVQAIAAAVWTPEILAAYAAAEEALAANRFTGE